MGEDRQRDAERSKRLLLEAAVAEFAAHGLGGARVEAIAARAGVNKQLISYYFGGKQGLYEALGNRWREAEQTFAPAGTPLPALAAEYARRTLEAPDQARLVIREGLDGHPGPPGSRAAQQERFAQMLTDLRSRQEAGELAADLDPASLAVALFGLCAAPVSFPHVARGVGLDPDAPGFAEVYAVEVGRLVARLCAGRDEASAPGASDP
jgi:AcrR family transcriptional regulator